MDRDVEVAITPTGRFTTSRLEGHWYVACLSRELRRRPLARTVLGVPLALFRDAGGAPAAVVDRCPHRNVPLSVGRCVGGELECRYHGWRFARDGSCVEVPGLDAEADRTATRVATVAAVEQDGFVWVAPAGTPTSARPPRMRRVGDPGFHTAHLRLDVPGPMVAAVENALDVPHTSFLHRGLFRGRRERVPVKVTVRHGPDHVEARFEGEPVPPGLLARVLGAEGGIVEHTDRFTVPALAQVEYRLGEREVVLNAFYTPVDDRSCVLHAVAAFRLPVPAAVARAAVMPLARLVLHQDNEILRRQRANVERFGGERYVSTPIDLLGPHIARLLRRHARGEPPPAEVAPDEHVTLLT